MKKGNGYKSYIIEESLSDKKCLEELNEYFVSTKIEEVEGDEFPVWHTNEYYINSDKVEKIMNILKDYVKKTWYIHAYNSNNLFVVLYKKVFKLSIIKDEKWKKMIEYGVNEGKVDISYLEDIPTNL